MTPNHSQPDEILERTLAALRDATPPEGMEARVLQTLDAQRLTAREPAATSRFLALLIPQSTWLRGAITGAAAAALIFGAVLFASHLAHRGTAQQIANVTPSTSAPRHVGATRVGMNTNSALPCAPVAPHALGVAHSSRGISRDEWGNRSPHLIPASFAPSKPAPPAPLTAQERALVQLARTATPAELAALNRETANQSAAEREAAFRQFFAPSPEVIAIDKAQGVNVDPNPTTAPQPQPTVQSSDAPSTTTTE